MEERVIGLAVMAALMGFAGWKVWQDHRNSRPIQGRPPYPPIRVLLSGGVQIVDLRGVPFPGNTHLVLDFAIEALRTQPPAVMRVWVLPDAVLDAWLAYPDLIWVIIGSRLGESFKQPGDAHLYIPPGRITPEQQAILRGAQVQWVSEMTTYSTTGASLTIEAQLGPVPTHPPGPTRPPVRATLYNHVLWHYVMRTDDAVYVDLRRANLNGTQGRGIFEIVGSLLDKAPPAPLRVWLVGAWQLEIWKDDQVQVLGTWAALLGKHPPTQGERLLVFGQADPALVTPYLDMGLVGVRETVRIRDRAGTFEVPIDVVLEDLILAHAWDQAMKLSQPKA